MKKLVRFGIAMEEPLLLDFDKEIRQKGYTNRSEAIRDLVRESLVKQEWFSNKQVSGVISMVYNHHQRELVDKLLDVQHDYQDLIIANQHIHLDHHNCLEVIVTKGKAKDIQRLSDRLKSVRGVKHVNINMATVGKELD
ncbi:MAG: nickel-responsive transcriptional regulator NikR [Candidatus Omnitrophica bacterium]|nr:nickel-responsive transcriptional regulator NikR [Candidatus Omnitrophota bacterium]